MDTKIVPASAAGTKVNMNVYINDNNISNDISYYTKSDIVLSIDERVCNNGVIFNTDGITNGAQINTQQLYISSFSPLYYMQYTGNGKNGVLSAIEVTIPEYAQPGDIFYFDICDTFNHKSHITFSSSDTVIYEENDSIQTADTSGDAYLKNTPYDGYILIQPDSDENYSIGSRPYEKVIKDSLTYAVYDDHAEVVHCDFEAENVVILPEINDQKVTAIADCAFVETRIKTVSVPESIERIGIQTFSQCKLLTEIKLPEGIEEIPSLMFYGCSALESIELPSSINKISKGAFSFSGLKSIIIPENVTTLDAVLVGCEQLSSVKLPANLESINSDAFSGCSSLESIELPDTLKKIGQSVFKNTKISKINIPASVTTVEFGAFSGSSIKEINYPEDCEILPANAYSGAWEIKTIKLPSKITAIPERCFQECYSLTELILPDTLTSIGSFAFVHCSIKEFVIPESVTKIDKSAFLSSHIKSVEIPDRFTELPEGMFSSSTVEKVKLPSKIESIPEYMFNGCANLTSIDIPSSVKEIGKSAFRESGLKSVAIPDSVTVINDSTFMGCKKLSSVKLPAKLEVISDSAFRRCNIDSLEFPDTLKRIGQSAFGESYLIRELSIPASVISLKQNTFANTYITCITYPDDLETLPDYAFSYAQSLTTVKLPSKLKAIPKCAFYFCTSLKELSIPDTVTTIGEQAFYCCSNLKSIYIPSSVTAINNSAFSGSLTTIYGYKNSVAETYAKNHNISFIEVESRPVTTPTVSTITSSTTTTEKSTTTSTSAITAKTSGGHTTTAQKTTTKTTLSSSTTIEISTTTEPVPPEPHRLDIQGKMTVKEMTIDDIKKAGINVADPSNYHVFEYEIEMAFAAKTYRVIRYEEQPKNDTYGDSHTADHSTTVPITGAPSVIVNGEKKRVIGYNVTPKEEMYMIISGECKWLKEFYDVQLIVINKDQDEALTNCSAILNVPDGLTLMNCNQIQSLGTLDAGSAFDVHWYVRGDVAGDYDLTAQFTGNNRGQQFTYNFKSENTLHVYAGDALKMKITVPRYSFLGEDYPVKISFKNVSDRPIYNIEHKINGISQGTYTYKSVHGETEQTQESIYTENINAKKELPRLDPGDEIVAEVKIHDAWKSALENGIQDQKILYDILSLATCVGENIYCLAGDIFSLYLQMWVNSITVEHVLQSVKVVTLKNSTVEVPYELEWEDVSSELAEKYSKNMLMEHIKFYFSTVKKYNQLNSKQNTNRIFYYKDNNTSDSSDNIRDNYYFKYYIYIVSDTDAEPVLTLFRDIYYKFNVPEDGGKVNFYIIKNGIRQDAPHSKVTSSDKYVNDDFDVEVLTGDYTITEDGNIIFSSDAYVKITPKKAGIKATFGAVTEDGKESVNIPIEVVDEHECKGEKFILNPPIDGNDAYMASFCSICHELIECKMLPNEATAMFSNGECYDDIRGAIADYKNYDDENLKLYIWGNINIVEDVNIPEDIMTIIVPDTKITVNDGCNLIAKGEVKDFSGYDYDLSGNGPISSKTITTYVTTNTTSTTCVSTTTPVVTTTSPVKTIEYKLGDVNNDKMIDSGDASSVLAYYARISTNQEGGYNEEQLLAADVNHDGLINAIDASNILAYYAYASTAKDDIMSIDEYIRK